MKRRLIVHLFIVAMVHIFLTGNVYAVDIVEKGKKISIEYTLTVDGQEVETTKDLTPLVFEPYRQMLIPGLEKELLGMKQGEAKKVVVQPKDAYGDVDQTLIREFNRSQFPSEVELMKGMVIEMQDDQGNLYPATINDVKQESVFLDFNHPLAGKVLMFDVQIVAIENVDKK